MVEQIFDIKEIKRECNKVDGFSVSIALTDEKIKIWKDEGKFVFIKRELAKLPKLKFACTRTDNENIYYFFPNTQELQERIYTLLNEIHYNGKKVPLTKCKKTSDLISIYGTSPSCEGTPQSCPLFW